MSTAERSVDGTIFTPGDVDGVAVDQVAKHEDARGWLLEGFRSDELPSDLAPPMCYLSLTRPGVTRGPHEHRDQTDNFVFVGSTRFKIYLWDARPGSRTQGNRQIVFAELGQPLRVVVPPGVVHAYQNVGDADGLVFNAPNRLFGGHRRKEAVDEIRHEGEDGSPYVLE